MHGRTLPGVSTLPPGFQVIHGERAAVLHEIRRATKAHEVRLVEGPYAGEGETAYALLERYRPRRPEWRKPAAIVGGVVAGGSALGWLVVSLVTSAVSAVASLPSAALGFVLVLALLGLGSRLLRRRETFVEVTTRVRVK